jgi:hypothetical protein
MYRLSPGSAQRVAGLVVVIEWTSALFLLSGDLPIDPESLRPLHPESDRTANAREGSVRFE